MMSRKVRTSPNCSAALPSSVFSQYCWESR